MRVCHWAPLLLLWAVLPLESGGQHRRRPESTSLSPGWSFEPSSSPQPSSAVSLRDRLLNVRERLRAPDLSRHVRRLLKSRKRRLRDALREQRAQRRRERRKLRRQRQRTLPQERAGRLATVPEMPSDSAGVGSPFDDDDDADYPAAGVVGSGATEEDWVPDASGRPLAGDQLYPEEDGWSLDLREDYATDGDRESMEDALAVGAGAADDGEAQRGAEEAPQVGASVPEPLDSGGFFSSLWDWVASDEDTAGAAEPTDAAPAPAPTDAAREREKDAGWTVPPLRPGQRPNIVLIMTDDLDVELGSLRYMPKLRRFLQDEGVTFRHGYVSTPLCCPSRSSYLTGMFIHNHQVYTNRDNCSSPLWQQTHEQRTYAAYLQRAGYRTGYFGKYMNRYEGEHIPAGWDHWSSLILNSKYYNYSMNVNGERVEHGWQYPKDYLPLVIVNQSLSFFERSRREYVDDPVLMVLSFPGPHGPEDAAPEYTHLFMNATDHHTPAYDFAPNGDKQWFLRHVGKMDEVERTFTDLLMTKRLQTLQSVDDGIERVYRELATAGELNNTYILFTSDHGYHLGQFGVAKGKSYPFEFDIRVPFVVRGPGIRAGSRSLDAVLNVDVAPTLLEMGGVPAPPQMDGRSFLPLLDATDGTRAQPVPWPTSFIVEGAGKRPEQRQRRRRLQVGAVRPDDEGVLYVSALQRLQEVCDQPEYSSPCRHYQKWACHHDGHRWRVQKCRRRRRLQQMCPCRGGVVQGTRRIRRRERQDQLRFLKDHMSGDFRHERFVKELRGRRSAPPPPPPSPSPSDSLVKQFVVEEDAGHVDDYIRRTDQELQILQTHVRSVGWCAIDNSTCPTTDRRSQRLLVNDQIRRLKHLLAELKGIRRHLYDLPPDPGWEPDRPLAGRGGTFEDGDFVDYADGDDEPLPLAPWSRAGRRGGRKMAPELDGGSDVAFCPCRPMDDRAERQWVREYTKQTRREGRAQLRRERRKQKRRKQRKKALLASQNCDFEGLNCFVQDNDHWKTPPLWTRGPVCICVGASNGTYDCLRTVSDSENWIFCRFITGFLSFYDLTVDPYQLHNLAPALSQARIQELDVQLAGQLGCAGPDQCRPLPDGAPPPPPPPPTPAGLEQPAARPPLEPARQTAPPATAHRMRRTGDERRRRRGGRQTGRRQRQQQQQQRRLEEQQRRRARRMELLRHRRRWSNV